MSGFWTSESMQTRLPGLIDPFDSARVVNCAYELSMGAEAFVTSGDSNTKSVLQPGRQIDIPPGQFANLLTEEIVEIPANALGLISVKFRLKQRGLVNVSGFHVDPGFRGRLLFSVYNAGPNHVVLARGEAAFLLWYAALETATANTYVGSRAGQTEISNEDVMLLLGDVATPQALARRIDRLEHGREIRDRVFWAFVAAIISALVALGGKAAYDNAHTSSPPAKTTVTTTTPTVTSPSRG